MKQAKSTKFSENEIELLNAHGPFNHSHWEGKGIRVSHEEGLAGRADFLVHKIREIILNNYSKHQLRSMSIADIGCYDAWILHKLSDLPFRKLVGIEPREKNIDKGIKIRALLDIKTRVELRKGSLESLGKEYFDIVLCIGVFHHVESISSSMKQLDKITKRMLIIDSICMPSKNITEEFKRDIEMKDVIYKKKNTCGYTGQKYESAYYDGSTSVTAVISVPSLETLLMHFDALAYNPICIAAGPEDFKKAIFKSKRIFEENLLYGIRRKESKKKLDPVEHYAEDYEDGLISTIMSSAYINPLYHYYSKKSIVSLPKVAKKISKYIDSTIDIFVTLIKEFKNPYEREIIKNFRFNPVDKICFEQGKIFYFEKKYFEAIETFKEITQKINADWRCVYRSFYMLSMIYKKLGKQKKSQYYKNLCSKCHPNFPLIKR